MTNPQTQREVTWRVLEPNTLRAYALASQDFQQVTGVHIDHATHQLAIQWKESMESRGFKINTIRQRLSALRTISGIQVQLPKREKIVPFILNSAQIRNVMAMVTEREHRMLLVRLLTIGTRARTVRMPGNILMRHMIGEHERTLDTQQVTRLIKRYCRNAGLNDQQVSLRVWCLSGRYLVDTLSPTELAKLLDVRMDPPGKPVESKPLHGIGRRSFAKAS